MALIIETGSVVPNANTYTNQSDLASYVYGGSGVIYRTRLASTSVNGTRLDEAGLMALDDGYFTLTATLMNDLRFAGYPTSSTQNLAFPRYIYSRRTDNFTPLITDSTEIPNDLKEAQLEWIIDVVINDNLLANPSEQRPSSVRVGEIEVELSQQSQNITTPFVPPIVYRRLRALLRSNRLGYRRSY